MDIRDLCQEASELHIAKKWPERSVGDDIALMHSELSEALEFYRDGHALTEFLYTGSGPVMKPDGVPTEMADVVIRVAQFCGSNGIDLARAIKEKMAYNWTRPERHGGKII